MMVVDPGLDASIFHTYVECLGIVYVYTLFISYIMFVCGSVRLCAIISQTYQSGKGHIV